MQCPLLLSRALPYCRRRPDEAADVFFPASVGGIMPCRNPCLYGQVLVEECFLELVMVSL